MNLEQILKNASEDNLAFREVYDLTIKRVYAYVFLRVRNRDLALDICQNIYLALWQSLKNFKFISEPHFYSFLFTIARRQVSKARSKIKTTVTIDEGFDIQAPEVEKEDYRVLLASVRNLKENERLCIELRYFKDLKFQDIAVILGTTENNAKVIHHRAIQKLKRELNIYD